MTTTMIIHADINGAFWWPIGEPWVKHGQRYLLARTSADRTTLREAVDCFAMDHSGDSSDGITLSDAWLEVRRTGDRREVRRFFPLTMFPSVADYLSEG